jgi:hypothetical protein
LPNALGAHHEEPRGKGRCDRLAAPGDARIRPLGRVFGSRPVSSPPRIPAHQWRRYGCRGPAHKPLIFRHYSSRGCGRMDFSIPTSGLVLRHSRGAGRRSHGFVLCVFPGVDSDSRTCGPSAIWFTFLSMLRGRVSRADCPTKSRPRLQRGRLVFPGMAPRGPPLRSPGVAVPPGLRYSARAPCQQT